MSTFLLILLIYGAGYVVAFLMCLVMEYYDQKDHTREYFELDSEEIGDFLKMSLLSWILLLVFLYFYITTDKDGNPKLIFKVKIKKSDNA